MPDITLASEPRTETGSGPSGRLRRAGKVPAVVYGLGSDPLSISVPALELAHVLAGESGANTLINLDVNGESVLTLARQIHRHPFHPRIRRRHFLKRLAPPPRDDYLIPLPQKRLRQRPPNSAAAAGDQDRVARHFHASPFPQTVESSLI